jgi:hypothetical protein
MECTVISEKANEKEKKAIRRTPKNCSWVAEKSKGVNRS